MRKLWLEHGLFISWGIAIIATAGSLYFSEVKNYIPCTYCWYQRILMYPLVILLGIAAVRKDYRIFIYTLPMTVLGLGIGAYHYMTQKTDWFTKAGESCGLVPCNTIYVDWLGFITIPFMSLTAFALITIISIFTWRAARAK